jgi:hypothetical protein
MTVGIQQAEGFVSRWQRRKIHGNLLMMKDMAPWYDCLPKGQRCLVSINSIFYIGLQIFCGVAT